MNIFHLTFKCHHWYESYSKVSCWSFRASLIILLILWQFPLVWFCQLLLKVNYFFQFSSVQFSSVQSLSRVWLFATPWTAARQASLSTTNSQSLPKPKFIEVGDAIQPSHPLSSPFPPALNPSQHQSLLQWVNCSHEVAKVLEFQL